MKLKQKKPFFALAPMEDVTDTVFRQIVCDIGGPDLFFTEFLSVEGFSSKGRESVVHRLKFTEKERPLVAQIWGEDPEKYYAVSKELVGMGFNGIDINMGCSVRKVVHSGMCGAMITKPELAKDIVLAVKEGAGSLPVSVKTRVGFEKEDIDGWLGLLLGLDLDCITVHGRIVKDGYNVPANWDYIKRVVDLKNDMGKDTCIIGNGDVQSLDEGKEYGSRYGVDGVMVGRGVLFNPWFFSGVSPTFSERLELLKRHIVLFRDTWSGKKNYSVMKKYIRGYINGFDGANELRMKFLLVTTFDEALDIISSVQV